MSEQIKRQIHARRWKPLFLRNPPRGERPYRAADRTKSEPTTATTAGSRHLLVRGTSMMKKNAAFIIDSAFRPGEGAYPSRFSGENITSFAAKAAYLGNYSVVIRSQSTSQRVSSCAALRPLHARNGKAGRFAFTSNTFELKSIEIENDLKTIESSSSKPKRFTSGAPLQRLSSRAAVTHSEKRSISFFPELTVS